MCSSRVQSAELGAGSFEDTSHRTQHHNISNTAVLSTALLSSIIEKSYFVEGVPVGDEAPLGRVGAAGRLRRHLAGVHEAVAVVVLRHGDQGRGGEVRAGGLVTGLLQYLTLATQLQHRSRCGHSPWAAAGPCRCCPATCWRTTPRRPGARPRPPSSASPAACPRPRCLGRAACGSWS